MVDAEMNQRLDGPTTRSAGQSPDKSKDEGRQGKSKAQMQA